MCDARHHKHSIAAGLDRSTRGSHTANGLLLMLEMLVPSVKNKRRDNMHASS